MIEISCLGMTLAHSCSVQPHNSTLVRIILCTLAVFMVGCIFALMPVTVFCSLPGVQYSNACGHNAVYWLIVTLPLGKKHAALWVPRLFSKPHRK